MTIASSISQMLPQLPSFPVLTSSILFLFVLVRFFRKSRASTRNIPPGPPKLPIIGNLHQMASGSLPHHTLTNLAKKHGPVMHLQLGEQFFVIITSAEAAKEVLKTKELNFAQRPTVLAAEVMAVDNSSFVFAPFGDYWKQIRKVCVEELLSNKSVQSFRSIREQEVWDLMEYISSQEGVAINIYEKMFTMTNNITSRAAFGKKYKDQSAFMSLLGEAVQIAAGFNLADLYPSLKFLRYTTGVQPALKRIQKKIDKILDDIIVEHKSNKKDESSTHRDVLDVLLKLQKPNDQIDMQLTNTQIKSITMDIFSAGTETNAATMGWAMAELIRNPRIMEKVQAELRQAFNGKTKIEEADIQNLEYLKLVIKETMRLHPGVVLESREAREKCEIQGYEIPAKAKIIINAYALGRDPNYWEEPECFKPERFIGSLVDFKGANFEFIPFGSGRRICPGIQFAIANIELALAQLLYHFDWKLANGLKPEDLDMTEAFGVTVRLKNNMQLIPTVRIPFRE